MRAELTDLAERDIRDILRSTIKLFGPKQVRAYAAVIERGIAMVVEEPERPVSAACDEIVPDVPDCISNTPQGVVVAPHTASTMSEVGSRMARKES